MERYSRHIQLPEIGEQGQEKLAQAKILVVGAGGLGCPVLQYLAGAGIGTIGIIDFDTVELSNLHRQVLFDESSLGENKALAAGHRLKTLNSGITVHTYPKRLEAGNILDIFRDYQLVVDATDDIPTRYLISEAALIADLPVVYGALYRFEGQVSVFNHQNGPTYHCLFPDPPGQSSVASCSDIGILGVLPGIIGCMQANEVFKLLLGLNGILSGKLLHYNALQAKTSMISIPNKSHDRREALKKQGHLADVYNNNCLTPVKAISVQDALALNGAQFVDVRNPGEIPEVNLPEHLRIPLHEIDDQLEQFKALRPYVFFCATGHRSRIAISRLQERIKGEFYNLSAGAAALAEHKNNIDE